MNNRANEGRGNEEPTPARVLLLGTGTPAVELTQAIAALDVEVERAPALQDAPAALSENIRAVVSTCGSAETLKLCQKLGAWHFGRPVLLVREGSATDTAALYAAGVTAIFDWQRDRELLFRLLGSLFGGQPLPDERDRELADALCRELGTQGLTAGLALKARVLGRVAFIAGQVDALWKREALPSIAERVEGLHGVVLSAVSVRGSSPAPPAPAAARTEDEDLERRVRALLRTAASETARTVAVSVDAGVVTIAGAVARRDELLTVLDRLHELQGVRAIRDLVTVAPQQARRARRTAEQVRRALAVLLPQAELVPVVFGGVLVLDGVAPSDRDRLLAGELGLQQSGVERVVNNVRVLAP